MARREEMVPAGTLQEERPRQSDAGRKKFVVGFGRGGVGKTVWLRYVAERALLRGSRVLIADADRTNATLTAFFGKDNVSRPESTDSHLFREWQNQLIEDQAEQDYSVVEDIGGGGEVFMREYARFIGLVDFCEANGIQPVAVHFIGGDKDHLAVLRDIEESRAFCPSETIVVMNEAALPPGRTSANGGFETVESHSILKSAKNRGVRCIRMPFLECMSRIDAGRLLFGEAAARVEKNGVRLGLVDAHLTRRWSAGMEAELAPVSDWLP